MDGEGAGHQPGWQFSPLLIGLLGVIAGFMMVATYHFISLGCCCCNNNQQAQDNEPNTRQDTERNYDHRQEWPRDRIRTSSVMRVLMPVFRFSSKDCNEDTCAVCLGDFKEGEQVRVLPECLHLFHVPCIDMWLSSHSNCPLCRANANAVPPPHLVLALPDSGGAPQPEFHRAPDYGVWLCAFSMMQGLLQFQVCMFFIFDVNGSLEYLGSHSRTKVIGEMWMKIEGVVLTDFGFIFVARKKKDKITQLV